MYRIYVTTVDGKVKSKSSGGFNIRMKVDASTAGKALEKKKSRRSSHRPREATSICNDHRQITLHWNH